MTRFMRGAAVLAAAGSIACVAAAPAAATVPLRNACTATPNVGDCVNATFDTASWSVGVSQHVVDEWVWNDDGTRNACETWDFVQGTVCPSKKLPQPDDLIRIERPVP